MNLYHLHKTADLKSLFQDYKSTPSDIKSQLPRGRSSRDHFPTEYGPILELVMGKKKLVRPEFNRKVIPLIRKLALTNADLGLALDDSVKLINTGHTIKFDPGVDEKMVQQMREHVYQKCKQWGTGTAGLHGLINKLIAQLFVGGAISGEFVPSRDKSEIKDLVLVNTETIEWSFSRGKWIPYQRAISDPAKAETKLYRLNGYTFRYIGLGGDTSSPYGIPPFITALEPLADQKIFRQNIQTVTKIAGLLGHVEVKLDKPRQNDGESDAQYKTRLNALLKETKDSMQDGAHDGIVVGYMDDHEFTFHQTAKGADGMDTIFQNNQTQVANGLKTPPQFLGVSGGAGTESGLSIVFTKMLSQLSNAHEIISDFLSYGIAMDLRLAGYKFKYLKIEFNKTTITDDLKLQQAREIKQRVNYNLFIDGIISLDQYAESMGYEKPHSYEPVVSFEDREAPTAGGSDDPDDPEAKRKREEKKDQSDRRSRDKSKPQPKRRDNDSRPR